MSEEQQSEHESEHATTDESGALKIDIEDAGGRELRDVDEKPPEDEVREIEEERERRLDPDNRPDDAEVDNTERTFDSDTGLFTDSEEYDEGAPAPYAGSGEED
jgi:hypothetical protein